MWRRGTGLDGPNVEQQARIRRHGAGLGSGRWMRGRGFMRFDGGKPGFGVDGPRGARVRLQGRASWVDGWVVLAALGVVALVALGWWHD